LAFARHSEPVQPRLLTITGVILALALSACSSTRRPPTPAPAATLTAPSQSAAIAPSRSTTTHSSSRPDHIVVAVLENHAYGQLIGNADAPFINSLAMSGALFTRSYAITHPSQPNYLALFSGSRQGVTSDSCPHTFSTPNLGRALLDAGFSFVGYSEDLPTQGFAGCRSGAYVRKHNPWVNFANLPASVNQPFTAFPRNNFSALPTLSFVIPNLDHDMHDGTVTEADHWLRDNLGSYVEWARQHNSMFILTCDEDDASEDNRIVTIAVGTNIKPGRVNERIDHYRLLRTFEDAYGLAHFGASANASPISAITPVPRR
jgi:acid phosphatase